MLFESESVPSIPSMPAIHHILSLREKAGYGVIRLQATTCFFVDGMPCRLFVHTEEDAEIPPVLELCIECGDIPFTADMHPAAREKLFTWLQDCSHRQNSDNRIMLVANRLIIRSLITPGKILTPIDMIVYAIERYFHLRSLLAQFRTWLK